MSSRCLQTNEIIELAEIAWQSLKKEDSMVDFRLWRGHLRSCALCRDMLMCMIRSNIAFDQAPPGNPDDPPDPKMQRMLDTIFRSDEKQRSLARQGHDQTRKQTHDDNEEEDDTWEAMLLPGNRRRVRKVLYEMGLINDDEVELQKGEF